MNALLIKQINKEHKKLFQQKCKNKNLTMTRAIRIFISSIAAGELIFTKEKIIKESQLKIER